MRHCSPRNSGLCVKAILLISRNNLTIHSKSSSQFFPAKHITTINFVNILRLKEFLIFCIMIIRQIFSSPEPKAPGELIV